MIVFANVAQALALRVGIRRVLPVGLLLAAAGLVLYARLPVDGHYFWDLFPAFLLSGIGMAFAFIPMTIGALAGVRSADAGIASGLINTTQQIGGAIGVAAATTIAATYTSRYLDVASGCGPGKRRRADARLRDRLLRARRRRGARRSSLRARRRVEAAARRRGGGRPPRRPRSRLPHEQASSDYRGRRPSYGKTPRRRR